MEISLIPAQQKFVDEAVAAGHYASPADLIAAAVEKLQQEQQWLAYAKDRIQAGLDDAEAGRTIDGEVAMAEVRQAIDQYRPLQKAS